MSHKAFEFFQGKDLKKVCQKAAAWVNKQGVAAKSVGIEFVEATGDFIMSVGYGPAKSPRKVKILVQAVANLDQGVKLKALGEAMGKAAAAHKGVVCHELTITEKPRVLHAVFLVHE